MNFYRFVLRWLRHKYRFIVIDHRNFEEKTSFSSSIRKIIIGTLALMLIFFFISLGVLKVTGLHNFFFSSVTIENSDLLRKLYLKVDSIEKDLEIKKLYLQNFQKFIKDEEFDENLLNQPYTPTYVNIEEIDWNLSEEEKKLREIIETNNKKQ